MLSEYLLSRQKSKSFGELQPPKEKKLYVMPKKSKKTIDSDKELKKLAKMFLAKPENQVCNIQIDKNCTRVATVVNHTKRRGANKLNVETFEPSCTYCNGEIEKRDQWARENGHLKSKFTPPVVVAEYDKELNTIIVE